MFYTHFQLPIWYEIRTNILTSLRQNNSTHILDHIHEWRRCKRLIKAPIPDQLLADWFTKSLLPPLTRDVATGDTITEEKDISRAQYLYLVYSHFRTLCDLIPNVPHPSTDPTKTLAETPVDFFAGTIQPSSTTKPNKPHSASTTTSSTTAVSTKVNAIQSS